jgi:hypothetical protein
MHVFLVTFFLFFARRYKKYSVRYKRLVSFLFISSGNISTKSFAELYDTSNSTDSYYICVILDFWYIYTVRALEVNFSHVTN